MDEEELQDALEDETTEEEESEEEIEDEETEDEEEAAEEEETSEVPVPARSAPNSISVPTILSAEEREYGEALFTPQQLAFMESLNARSFAAGQASMAVANAGMEQVLSGASAEYRQMVSPRLTTVISRMTPQQRADPHAADDALAVIMAEEARETGEGFWQVVTRHSQMRGGATPPRAAKPVIAPKPAATRAPSPSNSGSRPAARSTASGASSNTKLLSKVFGVSEREAEVMGLK